MKNPIILFLAFALIGSLSVYGLDVDEAEFASIKDTSVEFINYEGPHSKIETIAQIMGVGIFLGESIKAGMPSATYAGKYRVIHAIDEGVDKGLDADIFIVLPGAEVDHIVNMRYMIGGYLMAAYDYDREDALLLAEFVTIYNAVFRGKMDFFSGKYKQIVTRNLRADAAGIFTLYTDWPGKTQMVIPLTKKTTNGGLGSLDTDVLTEDEVIEEMRTQDDRGLDSRKDMTELKEREIEEAQREIEEEQEDIDAERERIDRERQRLADERERLAAEKEKADSESERTTIARTETALDSEADRLAADEETVDEREQDLAEREEEQAERIERVQQEREEIASDERTLMEQDAEVRTAAATTGARSISRVVTFLEIRDVSGEPLGRLIHIDTGSGAVLRASTLNSIRNRRIESLNGALVVVAGTTAGQGAVRLMTMDAETLETETEGTDDIYEGSFFAVDGIYVYAITGTAESWKLGKFDSRLSLRQVSDIDVYENSSITVEADGLFIVGADGAVHLLSTDDLSDKGVIQ